jgi:sugar O-acyltransferase (sialic acid O-acetyltransferase NeuD family)
MRNRHVIVLGGGGHAEVVISTLQAAGRAVDCILDDNDEIRSSHIQGVPVVGHTDRAHDFRHLEAIIAIGDNQKRRELAERANLDWTIAVHPSAVVHPDVPVGPGAVVFAGAVIQPGARIGAHAIINTSATVDHDCIVGDFAHIAPGVHLGGNVSVGEGAFIGLAAVVLPNHRVGEWATLGAGSVAIADTEPGSVAVGVPSRYVRRNGQPVRSWLSVCETAPAKRATRIHATFIGLTDTRWGELLSCARHDFYHLPEYLKLCGKYEYGEPVAFYAEDGRSACLVPMLLRRLPDSLGAPLYWCDLVSPYGYPCPLFTQPMEADRVSAYLTALQETSDEIGACSVFVRSHPLLDKPEGTVSHTAYIQQGKTVSIDLTLSEHDMWHQTRDGHRGDIRRLEKLKFVPIMDDWALYEDFGRIYRETMVRIDADASYHFGDDYFRDLRCALGDRLHLCCVLSPDGCLAGGGLFATTGDIMEYHLSGTDAKYHRLGPTKLMLHFVRAWGKRHGCSVLHLGGGVGAREDALFDFKAGFSPKRHQFGTLRMVVNERRWAALMLRARQPLNPLGDLSASYFPPYRRRSGE